jgi:hypothetical protein
MNYSDISWDAIKKMAMRSLIWKSYYKILFSMGIRQYLKALQRDQLPEEKTLKQICKGWNNAWAARPHYILACLNESLKSSGLILECGSGLTTILIGILAQKYNRSVISLEHNEDYSRRISAILRKMKIYSVNIIIAPLKSYGDYDWYDVTNCALMGEISIVICDGPPGNTRGGRYGLLPILNEYLSSDCTVILDDAKRSEEQRIANKWENQFNMVATLRGPKDDQFIILRKETIIKPNCEMQNG